MRFLFAFNDETFEKSVEQRRLQAFYNLVGKLFRRNYFLSFVALVFHIGGDEVLAYYFFDGFLDGGFCQGFIKRVFKHFRRCKDYSRGIYAVRIFCVEACDF